MTSKENPLVRLKDVGQSVWVDNLSRHLLTSGELKWLITEDAVTGVTSNPTIFEKAIAGSSDYTSAMEKLVRATESAEEVLNGLMIQDIQDAADTLKPVYDETKGKDGFVSMEVSPLLANDAAATMREVRRISKLVNRPNLMIKVPGTQEAIPAIQKMLFEGFNINVTLLFSVERYDQVLEAFLKALEQRLEAGQPIDQIASVASFFISRVDTSTDKQLEAKIKAAKNADKKAELKSLLGQTAIVNAKKAYRHLMVVSESERFGKLKEHGAQIQRVLWASTSTKNPTYRDVVYVEELIGRDTVNTMPENTLKAFRDHGEVQVTLDRDQETIEETLKKLQANGIDVDQIVQDLETAGVKAFIDSYRKLVKCVEDQRKSILAGAGRR